MRGYLLKLVAVPKSGYAYSALTMLLQSSLAVVMGFTRLATELWHGIRVLTKVNLADAKFLDGSWRWQLAPALPGGAVIRRQTDLRAHSADARFCRICGGPCWA